MKCVCGKEINSISKWHYSLCNVRYPTYEEYKYQVYLKAFPDLTFLNMYSLYVNKEYTLPMFFKEFGCSSHIVFYFLDYYGIQARTIKEANNLKSVRNKTKETCLEKYGVDNPTRKGTAPYLKREQTILNKYGVDNVFKLKEMQDYIRSDEFCLSKYGMTYLEQATTHCQKTWDSKSDEQKEQWFNSIHKTKSETNIEKRFREMLVQYNLGYEPQHYVDGKFFDFYTEDVLVEVNGDYFHANPLYYLPDQTLNFVGNMFPIPARVIWQRDELKRMIANSNNYDVIYIWENEIDKCKTHEQLYDLFIERMNLRNVYEQPN
jgi:hypothetical protein